MAFELCLEQVVKGKILGWGWDKDAPHQSLTVELWGGSRLLSTARASNIRPDVQASGRGTGRYGFKLDVPRLACLDVGPLAVKVAGHEDIYPVLTNKSLLQDVILRDLAETLPGDLRATSAVAPFGVEFEVSDLREPLEFFGRVDGKPAKTQVTPAKDPGRLKIVVTAPKGRRDGSAHNVELYAGTISVASVEATWPQGFRFFKGHLDGVRDGALWGWCFDEEDPYQPVQVEIYVDDQLRDIVVANHRRVDLNKVVSGGAIGFAWPLPRNLQDGAAHHVKAVPLAAKDALPQSSPTFVFSWRTPANLCRFGEPTVAAEFQSSAYGLNDAAAAEALAGASGVAGWRQSMPTLLRALGRKPKVTVFVPIYNAADSVALCLQSLTRNTTYPCDFLLIDDASPQAEIGPLLDQYKDRPGFRVIRNAENIGYTRNCNQALKLTEGDIVFLNSDTYAPPRWLERLVVAAYRRSDVATVTATSNHSGAFSVPDAYGANPTPTQITPEDFASLLSRASGLHQPSVPTGNGFCMYVRREAVEDIGGFDEQAFPRGYGEENDFCMRALKAGWANVIDDRSFVYHIRSASFGGQQPELQTAAQSTLAARHPDYTILTETFSNNPDILDARARARTIVNWLKNPRAGEAANRLARPRILYTLHYNGEGGTALTTRDLVGQAVKDFECFLLTTEKDVLTLNYWSEGDWKKIASLQLDGPMDIIDAPRPDYEAAAASLLTGFDISLLHIRHLIGHSFYLPRIAHRLNIPVIMSHHDFYAVCPTVVLVDHNGIYCRGACTPGFGDCASMVPLPAEMQPLKHNYIYNWRRRVEETFPYCDAFITTSPYVRDLFYRVFPALRDKHDFRVIEHGRDNQVEPSVAAAPAANEPFRVLLLGNILQEHKGFGVAKAIKALDVNGDVEFHFLGAAPPDAASVGVVHGRYLRNELTERTAVIKPNAVAIFSIWPETYCHTLSEAWQMGVPVLGSSYGAVGERIETHGGGWVVNCEDPASILELIRKLKANPDQWKTARDTASARNLRSTYAMAVEYIELYKQRLAAKAAGGLSVKRVFVIGAKTASDWLSPVRRLKSALRHPATRGHVNLIEIGLDAWRYDRFACDAASLAIIDDQALPADQVRAAQELAVQRGVTDVRLSKLLDSPLLTYVDERNWPPLAGAAAGSSLRINGQTLPDVILLQFGAPWASAGDLIAASQARKLARVAVVEVSSERIVSARAGAVEDLDDAQFARQFSALARNSALILAPEPRLDWEEALTRQLSLIGLPILIFDAAAKAEDVAQRLEDALKGELSISHNVDQALSKVSLERNAETVVAALDALKPTSAQQKTAS